MEFASTDVMAYVLLHEEEAGLRLNKTQAQVMFYCCYGAVLAAHDERLTDEHPKAWPFGLLFPQTVAAINRRELTHHCARRFAAACPADWLALIDQTLCAFRGYSAAALSRWSCRPASPWAKADPLAPIDDRRFKCTLKISFRSSIPEQQNALRRHSDVRRTESSRRTNGIFSIVRRCL